MKNTYINLVLFGAGAAIMWFFAFPWYAGTGDSIIPRKSILEFKKENDAKLKEKELANDLIKNAEKQTAAYGNLSQDIRDRVSLMISTSTLNLPRVYNDITKLTAKYKMTLNDINHTKTTAPDGIEELNSYQFSISMSGDYLDFREFIKALQGSLQLFRVRSLFFTSVNSADTRNTADGEKKQRFDIIFDAYELKQ